MMADASCGPSNALQNFQKHSTVDRTLQQDRLVSRRVQAENFRSEQGRNAGVLDPEFEAFQAGHPPVLDHDLLQHNMNFGAPSLPPAQFAPRPAATGWAADFQKLQISQTPPHAAQLRNGGNISWHQEFQRQHQQAPAMAQPQQFAPQFSNMGMQRPMGYMPMSSYQQPVADTQWKGKENWPSESQIDEAALDREFEMIASESLQNEAAKAEFTEAQSDQDVQQASDASKEHVVQFRFETQDQIREQGRGILQPEHEPILDQPVEQNVDEPIEDDGLAEPAGRLLEHVADNTTDKFQNSQFLDLMRRLRDRETVLKGEDFVDTAKAQQVDQVAEVYQHEERDRFYAQERFTNIIPPEEQDADLGRSVKMTGALPPMDDSGWSERDRPLPLDPSFRHRHLVDDF